VGLDIDGERVGRPYSFVNAPHEHPAEIYFNIVPAGPLTNRLAMLQAGDRLWVDQTPNGMLTLDELPQAAHLWMLATGTAIGPFLSMLKTDEPWQRFEQVVLVHGVRTPAELAYAWTIAQLQQAHATRMHFIPIVSREHISGALYGRIPGAIDSGQLEACAGLELSPDDSHVMLCGNKGMIDDTRRVLSERGMRKHRRREPGHISTESYY
jgi:ferredoxin--NADP+ reductase